MKNSNYRIILSLLTVACSIASTNIHQSIAQAASTTATSTSANRVILLAVAITILETNAGHIFRNAAGHLTTDTPANRKTLVDVASDSKNYLGKDKYGNDWYGKTRADNTQVWVRVRNSQVTNGGVNATPGTYDAQLGILKPGD